MVSDFLRKEISGALASLDIPQEGLTFDVSLEKRFGDYASNVAFVVASKTKENPREIAEKIATFLKDNGSKHITDITIAGPGFLNFNLAPKYLADELQNLFTEKGKDIPSFGKVNIEFISANPTGRLHIGHGRGAFYGDVLGNILRHAGVRVSREYYVNDSKESAQIKELGKTARGEGEQYKTPEVERLMFNIDFSAMSEADAGFFLGEKIQVSNQEFIEKKLGIHFDIWYSEEERLRASSRNKKMIDYLKEKSFSYEKDGAIWVKTSEYGDDEDRVVVRSDGTPSYFLSDISYHAEKFEREHDIAIDVWGADHHGHVKRMQAVKGMLQWKGELKIFIAQLVSLKGESGITKMSKRAGNVIYLEDLVEELGIDVVRWFFSEKALTTHMDFDIALAKEQSEKNPVFYVQYAHARACSVEEKTENLSKKETQVSELLQEKISRALATHLLSFPDTLRLITEDYAVHRLTTYVYELANHYARFYDNVRVIDGDTYSTGALALTKVTKATIAQCLGLLGISAPKKM